MKLIIDISKNKYNEIMKDDYIPDGNFRRNCIIAIRNGTPLDDIKVEIENVEEFCECMPYGKCISPKGAIEIIDRCLERGSNQ